MEDLGDLVGPDLYGEGSRQLHGQQEVGVQRVALSDLWARGQGS